MKDRKTDEVIAGVTWHTVYSNYFYVVRKKHSKIGLKHAVVNL